MNTEALDKEPKFDADVIVLACKAAGLSHLSLVAKHPNWDCES